MRLTSSIRQCIGIAMLLTTVACSGSDTPPRVPITAGDAGADTGARPDAGASGEPDAIPDASYDVSSDASSDTPSDTASDAASPLDAAAPEPPRDAATESSPSADAPGEARPAMDAAATMETRPATDAATPKDATPPPDVASPVDRPAPPTGGWVDTSTTLQRIGFGSCNDLTRSQAFWPLIVDRQPQAFLFLGDNAYLDYGDTYEKLGAQAGFKQLMAIAKPFAIWDDHDYGTNDGGGTFGGKDSYKKKFIDFWGPLGAVPADSPRRTRAGNYDAAIVGPAGKRVQLIMLDNRYFKGAAPSGTVLGADQWQWLADELRRPAELRIIMSGFQALGSSTTSEGWGEYPAEQQRLLDVIKTSQATGVVIVSGDKHYAEISRRDGQVGYPLYDFTSSSLTASNSYAPEANTYRDAPASATQNHNFGMMTIDWATPGRPLKIEIVDATTGTTLLTKSLSLSAIGGQ